MKLKDNIRRILIEEINKKYVKPTPNVERLVYKWLDDYFEGSQIYKDEYSKDYAFMYEFCKDGREIADLRIEFDDKSPAFGPKDKRPTNERSVKEVMLYIYPNMVNELITHIPVRKPYLLYLIEEWFEDTKLDEIQQGFNRNDLSLDYVSIFESKERGDICVPPITKPDDVSMEDMIDYIKKTTLYSYTDIEKHEEDEPGWIENLYLAKLRGAEKDRLERGDMNETELTEKCWKGYTQKGMKTMFGKRYPNCVKKTKK